MAKPAEDLQKDPLLQTAPSCEGFKVLEPAVLYARIGAGGMGAVYRGRHFSLECDVAVKVLKPDLAHDEQFVARFAREAKLAARISNDNVVRVLDVKEKNGIHYLVMEFVKGETARERVKRKGPLKEAEALAVVFGAAMGLREAHAQGIVHRDIKPDNVLVSAEGAIKLADLGLAKQKQTPGEQNLTVLASGVMGTPQYMPPEQWRTPDVTPAADVWALGATLYYLLAGHSGIPAGEMLVIAEHVRDHDFPNILTVRPDVRPEVAALLAKCTQRKPEQRFADARELVKALRPLVAIDDELLKDPEAGAGNANLALVTPPPRATLARIKLQVEQDPDDIATRPMGTPGGAPRPAAGEAKPGTDEKPTVPGVGSAPAAATAAPAPSSRRATFWIVAAVVLIAGAAAGGQAAGWFDKAPPTEPKPLAGGSDVKVPTPGDKPATPDNPRANAVSGNAANPTPPGPTLPGATQPGATQPGSGDKPERRNETPNQGAVAPRSPADPQQDARQALARGLEALPRAAGLDTAIEQFERALQLDGTLTEAKQKLVQALVQKHKQVLASDADAAFDAASRAGQLAPDDASVKAAVAAATSAVQQRLRAGISVRTPPAGAVLGDPVVRVAGSVAVANVRNVRVAVDGRDGASTQPFPRDAASEVAVVGGAFEANVRASGDGPQLLRVEATDVRGPVGEMLPHPVVVDTKPPVLAWDEPKAATVFAGGVVVTGTVKDDSECTVLVDGARAAVADGRWRATIELLADTTATITVSARDAAGNEAEPVQHTLRSVPAFAKVAWASPEPDAKRVAIGERMYPSVVRDSWTNQRMVLVPAGEFTMGSPASEAERGDDETAHRCVIQKAFWLGETEVTQDLWSRTMGGNPSQHRGDMNPVDSVSWDDCQRFLEKLRGGNKTGYRLPSEAEWEYACRAGSDAPFAFGASLGSEQANFDGSRPYVGGAKSTKRGMVLPVKSLPANAFGLFDMHGNVLEWCQDVWAPAAASTEEALGGEGNPVVRGGSWNSMASGCRSAFRFHSYERWAKNERLGLRLAHSLDAQ